MKYRCVIITVIVVLSSLAGCSSKKNNVKEKVDGSELWLSCKAVLNENRDLMPTAIVVCNEQEKPEVAIEELAAGLKSLFGQEFGVEKKIRTGGIMLGMADAKEIRDRIPEEELNSIGQEGFIIQSDNDEEMTIITGTTEQAVLYGVYHYLRMLQSEEIKKEIKVVEMPAYKRRILNHWDNLDGSVERGYAGRSIWKWEELPEIVSPRYKEYARANASIGINGTVLNNVNANPDVLSADYLKKVKVIADEMRPYGIKVYLSVNFASPGVLGSLPTSSPKDKAVIQWWEEKVNEIYTTIPDFGGFLVKANSEGQPGPMDFGCTHVDGANMLADALKPHNGIVMWRAFVYNPLGDDRAKQAYEEFMPFDGEFRDNVLVQVKNGPVDFQPREPISSLFGAMQKTAVMPELQITQEYLGFSTHLVYLGTLYQEFLQTDTYAKGEGSTVARITDGRIFQHEYSGIAGVANIGSDTNWCGHTFAQANWYVFGRLAWNPDKGVEEIASEWIHQTLTQKAEAVSKIENIMMDSREATVNYMTPLGLHHLMGWDHHYGPEPWCVIPGARSDWLPTYYHKADSLGIGFNRSSGGSNAVEQYFEPVRSTFDDPALCPPEFLLWFHHLPWDFKLQNGNTLWNELCLRYQSGVGDVRSFQEVWNTLEPEINAAQFDGVQEKLEKHLEEAIWWRDACLLYFQTFSGLPFPDEVDEPVHKLEELKKLKFDLKHHN